ncbi:22740_t:CDS:1 [Cetraspora pellucida]|uniref:22740_t:CDS:1 n=1 Tax=Cetraspora pellucida TaxID=1433469 RepID=A0A9N8VP29_9GLOM|nr:22740_t:CDS:1 [Cetraspora pellucida]
MSTPYKSFPFISSIISPPPSPKKYPIILPPLKFPFEFRTDDTVDSTSLESTKQQTTLENSFLPPIKQQSKYRMRLLDAPTDLLDYIEKSTPTTRTPPSHCLSRFSLSNAKSSPLELNHLAPPLTLGGNISSYPIAMPVNQDKNDLTTHKISVGRHRNARKNPYPLRAPTMSSPGITFKVDMYTPVLKDPLAILRSNEEPKNNTSTSEFFGMLSPPASEQCESQPSSPPAEDANFKIQESNSLPVRQLLPRKPKRPKNTQTKRSGTSAPQRKRKGNSLARVMADRGLLESVFNADITSNDIKSVRIPPPPSMQFDELMSSINTLNLDTSILEKMSPEITWKGQPLSIAHLPHYDALHHTEAHVVSVLRLTPVQYLTGKHTLVSAAQRYAQRSLPFRKSDAQKLLRIDVNKASKLWEFFQQVKWI